MTVEKAEYPQQDVVVITPTDEFLTVEVIRETRAISDSLATKYVVLDFRGIRRLRQPAFSQLVKFVIQLKEEDRRPVLCNLNSDIASVFRITRLDRTFDSACITNKQLAETDRQQARRLHHEKS